MTKVFVLFFLATGEPQAVFWGEDALRACFEIAQTYEVGVSCTEPSSENRPYLGLKLETSPRPKPRPWP